MEVLFNKSRRLKLLAKQSLHKILTGKSEGIGSILKRWRREEDSGPATWGLVVRRDCGLVVRGLAVRPGLELCRQCRLKQH